MFDPQPMLDTAMSSHEAYFSVCNAYKILMLS